MNGFVELITGTLGGGKTLFAVERIFEHLAAGGWVYTNIACVHDAIGAAIRERKRRVWSPERLVILSDSQASEFHRHVARGTAERCVMVVIDEAGLEFNSRDWAKTDRALLAFNALARKLDVILLYVSQQAADVDKQFRGKCRCEWQCRNLHNIRLFGVVPFPLPFYSRVCVDTSKGKPVKLDADVFTIPKWVFPLYDSNALVGKGRDAVAGLAQVEGLPLAEVPPNPKRARVNLALVGVFSLCGALSFFS